MINYLIGCLSGVVISYILFKFVTLCISKELKKKIKENIWSFVLALIILIGVFLFLFLPLAFKYIAVNVWGIQFSIIQDGKEVPLQLTDLGPLGDIYGSLNTLFTSITLGIVAYTAGLQRKSNQQTYTSSQIQLNEAKFSNFSNLFYSLLNQKQTKYNSLRIQSNDEVFDSIRLFSAISTRLLRLLKTDWSDVGKINKDIVKNEFRIYLHSLTKKSTTIYELNSYFLIYGDLFNLIERSDLSSEDKEFFKKIVRNSMTVTEQTTLFWMGVYLDRYDFIANNGVFNQFYNERMMPFAKEFYDETCFSNPKVLENWE